MLKDFCYFDKNNGDFVQLNCSLKEGLTDRDVNEFCNRLYTVKMDSTYSRQSDFGGQNNTSDLRKCFTDMLNNDVLSFEELYKLFDNDEQRKNTRVVGVIKSFTDMLDFKEKFRYTSKEFNHMIRMADSSVFNEESPIFERELRSSEYNTKMLNVTSISLNINNDSKKFVRK